LTTFSLVDLGLFVALAVTSVSVLLVYFRLKAMGRALAEYRSAFEATERSLEKATAAVQTLNGDSRALVTALVARTTEASGVLANLTREGRRLDVAKVTPFPGPNRLRDPRDAAIDS
jgi:hypothetical protein